MKTETSMTWARITAYSEVVKSLAEAQALLKNATDATVAADDQQLHTMIFAEWTRLVDFVGKTLKHIGTK